MFPGLCAAKTVALNVKECTAETAVGGVIELKMHRLWKDKKEKLFSQVCAATMLMSIYRHVCVHAIL